MVVAFPRSDVFSGVRFAPDGYRFQLMQRQEFSRQANGITRGKDFGSALWIANYSTLPLDIDDALDFEAILNSLDGVLGSFYAGDLRRPYPRLDPKGEAIAGSNPQLLRIGTSGKAIALSGVPVGYTLSRGDYLSFDYGAGPSRAYHQVMEATVVADANGETPNFEIRPHIRPGAMVGAPVTLAKPTAVMSLLPGSIEQRMIDGINTVISFQAIQIFEVD